MVREKKVRVKVVTEYNWETMSALDRGDLEPLNKASQSGQTWCTWLELHLADNGSGQRMRQSLSQGR